MDVPAASRRCSRELAVLVHDLGGPMICARRQIEERPVQHFTETEGAELAVELIRAAALDERCGCGRRRRVARIEGQRLPYANRERPLGRARSEQRRLPEAVDAREPNRIELVKKVRQILLELCWRRCWNRIEQLRRRLK